MVSQALKIGVRISLVEGYYELGEVEAEETLTFDWLADDKLTGAALRMIVDETLAKALRIQTELARQQRAKLDQEKADKIRDKLAEEEAEKQTQAALAETEGSRTLQSYFDKGKDAA